LFQEILLQNRWRKLRQWSNRLTDVHPENGRQTGGDGGDGAATEQIFLLGGHIELTCPVLVLVT